MVILGIGDKMTLKQLYYFMIDFFKSMGIIISPAVTLISIAYLHNPWKVILDNSFVSILIFILFLSIVFSIGRIIYLNCRTTIHVNLKKPCGEIEVKYANLFELDTNLVIGTNNFFDTALGEVISKNSIQGQFEQKYYNNDIDELNADISNALKKKQIFAIFEDSKRLGKKKKFPIGSTITLNKCNKNIFLCAYSTMNDRAVASCNIKDFTISLNELWNEIRAVNQCEPFAMAVLGSGLARLSANNSELLYLILSNFIAASREKIITKKLTIVLNKDERNKYDLTTIENFLKNLVRE